MLLTVYSLPKSSSAEYRYENNEPSNVSNRCGPRNSDRTELDASIDVQLGALRSICSTFIADRGRQDVTRHSRYALLESFQESFDIALVIPRRDKRCLDDF